MAFLSSAAKMRIISTVSFIVAICGFVWANNAMGSSNITNAVLKRNSAMIWLFLLVNTQRRNDTSPSLFVGADRAMRQPVAGQFR